MRLEDYQEIKGVKYHFDENGAIKTGWINDDNHWYFYDGNASLVSGWYKYYGKWYYLDANDEAYPYAAITNQVREINGVKYTFDYRLVDFDSEKWAKNFCHNRNDGSILWVQCI